jgi:hypothetical protein
VKARVRSIVILTMLIASLPSHTILAQEFSGKPTITQVDAQLWELREEISFVDKQGGVWKAPIGYRTDGASIPWPFWSIIGSPFTGNYVRAAIIHDVYCDLKSRAWKTVHSTFYYAMVADNVPILQAKVMYYAVAAFGPRWVVDANAPCPFGFVCDAPDPVQLTLTAVPVADVEEFKLAKQKIEAENTGIAAIDRMADERFYARGGQVHVSGTERKAGGQARAINQTGRLGPFLRPVLSLN